MSARIANVFRIACVIAGFAAQAVCADTTAWKMRVPAEARIGELALKGAQFEIACRGGKRGAMSLALVLADPAPAEVFPIDAFEGPDGVGETHALAQWSASDAAPVAPSRISGSYGVDGDAYIFSSSREAGRPAELAAIAGRLAEDDRTGLNLSVRRPAGQGPALEASASLIGRRAELAKLLRPCLSKPE